MALIIGQIIPTGNTFNLGPSSAANRLVTAKKWTLLLSVSGHIAMLKAVNMSLFSFQQRNAAVQIAEKIISHFYLLTILLVLYFV